MATVAKAFVPADIFQGPADIYMGVQNPVSAVPPVQYTNTLQLDSNGQPPIGAKGQIATVAVNAPGTNYLIGDTIDVVQSGALWGQLRVVTVSGSAVATVRVIRGGSGYSVASALATVGGSGTGFTADIATITSGYHLGLTEGPASMNIHPTFNLINADQFSTHVDAAFVNLACEIDFTIKEFQLAMIQRLFGGLLTATYYDLAAGGTNPATDLLQIGNSTSSSALQTSLLLVSPRRDVPHTFMYVLGYRCYMKSAIAMSVHRSKESMIKLKFGCLADPTRVAKDYVLQIVRGL